MSNFFIIGYGLSGGFGGIHNYEVIETKDESTASMEAWLKACEEYENYVGNHGLRDVGDIMEEDDVSLEEADEIYRDEREDWLDYVVYPFSQAMVNKLSGNHFDNPYKEQTDKLP